MTHALPGIYSRLIDDFSAYAADIKESWPDQEAAVFIGRALFDAANVVENGLQNWISPTEMKDSKELRRYIAEMLQGAASICMLKIVPDSIRKPARLTIITLLKQWSNRVNEFPVV